MTALLLLAAGLVLLYFGAEYLIKGAVSVAARLGITPLAIGLTVVAFGTSAPEMTVSISAVLAGSGDISAGNVIGSNIFNIAGILGLTAIICPMKITRQIIRFDVPIMIAVSVLASIMLWNRQLSLIEGIVLFAGILVYTYMTFWISKKNPNAAVEVSIEKTYSLAIAVMMILGGLLMLVGGSKCFVAGATQAARLWGISEAVIGLTIVSIGTSLPELATSLVAAIKKQSDIAVGNIIGSNIFNILAILGATACIRPYTAPGIAHTDLLVMLIIAVTALPFMWTKFILNRFEGAVWLIAYIAYSSYLCFNQ